MNAKDICMTTVDRLLKIASRECKPVGAEIKRVKGEIIQRIKSLKRRNK